MTLTVPITAAYPETFARRVVAEISGLKQQDNDRVETDDPAAMAAFWAAFDAARAR